MTKNSSSAEVETQESETLDDNNVDEVSSEVAVVAEDNAVEQVVTEAAAPVKKKAATRKKAATSGEAKVKKTPAKRSRATKIDKAESSPAAPVMKAYWGVFNPTMVQVAQFNYADEAEAKKSAADLTEKKKSPHFVQLIKKVM